MESWNISKKLEIELLQKASNVEDNSERILFILRNFGPQRFTNVLRYSQLSRSTVSKYLSLHQESGNIELKLVRDKRTNKKYMSYVITEKGIEELGEGSLKLKDEVLIINELKSNVSKLEQLIEFYKKISVEDQFIIHIIRIISKIGDNFFNLNQDRDLFLSLFYIFYNSILGQGALASKYWRFEKLPSQKFTGYKLKLDQFCELFNIRNEAINYLARYKLIKKDFGFYLLKRGENDFFFHEEDLLGTTTKRLIKDRLIDEIINLQESVYEEKFDLDIMAKEMATQLKEMGLIWDGIEEQFQLLLVNLIVSNAIDMGYLEIEREVFLEGLNQSQSLNSTKEGQKLKNSILKNKRKEINLNLLTIIE